MIKLKLPLLIGTMDSRSDFHGMRRMSLPLTAFLTAFIRLKDASSPGRKARILSPLLNGPYLASPDPTKLPRIIWCYWAQGYENAPEIVKYCLPSWKRHNPTWDVRFLTSETVSDYVNTSDMDTVFQKSRHFDLPRAIYADFLRLRLLRIYGIAAQKNNPLITCWSTTFESYFHKYQLVSSYYTLESILRKHRSVQAYCTSMYVLDFLIKFSGSVRLAFRSMPSLDARHLGLLHNWATSGGGAG